LTPLCGPKVPCLPARMTETSKDLTRALNLAAQVLRPDMFAGLGKQEGQALLTTFLNEADKIDNFTAHTNAVQLQAGKFLVLYNAGDEEITAWYSDRNRNEAGEPINAALTYDLVDGWIGERDDTIVPTPGQPWPRRDPLVVLAELTRAVLEDAKKARDAATKKGPS
jgi:hypothetical protein